MSQQEFESQQNKRPSYNYSDSVQENVQESEARPYYWSTKPNTGNIPKNEHPANFEDSIADLPPYSYQAQDRPAQAAFTNTSQQQQQARRSNLSPDGDAMEHGYRPFGSYNRQVPPWARPQHGNKAGRISIFLIIGILLFKPLLALLGVLLGAFVVLIGVAFAGLLVVVGFALVSLLIVFGLMGRRPPIGFFRSPRQGRRWY